MASLKLPRLMGVPASPKLGSISQGVTPEQGRYYDQGFLERILIPLKGIFYKENEQHLSGSSVDSTLLAILKGNGRTAPGTTRNYPTNASESNNPQKVRRASLRRAG